ncbi:glycoside hydrolase family 13 protein [Lactococcus allomyrinae]|uniref:Glycoside hydrolase family 13 protein n=1 Tax=Lactococcus allomyrinae TaxID=2419773 RepID=A0A387BBN7_9LACT|nr:glycoside hydrolase family 13 protein [Lactococcus allomyrinae]AYF99743.1 glycoside hydrolase family 13 protein [Lactococcus allomyrinae]
MYYFNSWNDDYKQPFGAIKVGQIMKVNFKTDKAGVQVKFVIRRDFGTRYEFEMQRLEEGHFSIAVPFDVGKGLYFYYFEIEEPSDWGTIRHFYGCSGLGGEGVLYSNENDVKPYQLTVFDKEDPAPAWYRDAVFYQIFPDRFYNGNEEGKISHPKPNSFIYGSTSDTPFYVKEENGDIARWDFFGGNIRGIIKKIPYLKELGVNAIYLNPIFSGTSNHRYDTNDYLEIDTMLGDEAEFKELIGLLHDEGMHLILDGVFSHVGKNSRYFNISGSYGDDEGAAKNPDSPYFSWFKFNNYPFDYKSWWGIKDLPEIDKDNESFREFIYGEKESVLTKWNQLGIDGWRLDVADELPDTFIRGIRKNLNRYSDMVLIGEVWEDASNKISYGARRDYILGDSLQGCMNYPFRDLIISFLNGQRTTADTAHHLMSLRENYPKDIFYNNLNNLGTHDTERILTMVGEENNALAISMMFSLPGVPCIYYGDEAALTGGKDPENRKYFPWNDIPADTYSAYQTWAKKRLNEKSLRHGEFSSFFTDKLLGILRYTESEIFIYIMNPTLDEVTVNPDEITFLQEFDFLSALTESLTGLVISRKSFTDLKMKR